MADHQTRTYESILDLLSSEENPTPLVRINRVAPWRAGRLYAKLEWYNPFGAVKDRIAAHMLHDADARGLLAADPALVEPTSGNTGLALAMLANARGLHLTTPLSKAIPAEKRTMLRCFGATVEELDDTLCPAPGAPEGAIARAQALAAQPGRLMLNQYENAANVAAHERTTGPEIWRQTAGRITHFVAGMGTCGTITGVGRFLKSRNPAVQVIGVHPEEGHDIPGVRSRRQLQQTKLFFPDEYDALVEVSNRAAYETCVRLIREESLIAGPSSGMALAGALQVIEDRPDALVVVIFPDQAFKYASSLARHFPEFQAAPSAGAPFPGAPMSNAPQPNAPGSADTCEIDEIAALLAAGAVLVDVRPPEVYAHQHVAGAVNVPLEALAAGRPELPADPDTPIVTVCNRGMMSLHGMQALRALGYRHVRSMNGGTIAWAERGLPTASGPAA